jgi:hypothetical protein
MTSASRVERAYCPVVGGDLGLARDDVGNLFVRIDAIRNTRCSGTMLFCT